MNDAFDYPQSSIYTTTDTTIINQWIIQYCPDVQMKWTALYDFVHSDEHRIDLLIAVQILQNFTDTMLSNQRQRVPFIAPVSILLNFHVHSGLSDTDLII